MEKAIFKENFLEKQENIYKKMRLPRNKKTYIKEKTSPPLKKKEYENSH
ncbi:hypothetical protein NXW94_11975 [Bacteroides ovatus]|nr:hypothetical protein [Bacteroides ovatus]